MLCGILGARPSNTNWNCFLELMCFALTIKISLLKKRQSAFQKKNRVVNIKNTFKFVYLYYDPIYCIQSGFKNSHKTLLVVPANNKLPTECIYLK